MVKRMSLPIGLLRDSFALAVEREPALTARFYDHLFARAPALRPMFRGDSAAQAEMLRGALIAVMEHLEDAPWLTTNLAALGARHQGYGVTQPMYDVVGEALIATLAEICGDRWSP